MTDTDDFSESAASHEERALPEAIYPLRDGSYGDRLTCDAERAALKEGEAPHLPWGKGALLLNPSTRSYLTPYGFKVLFEHSPKVIQARFEQAGLDPGKSYFYESAPDVLVHLADGRFVSAVEMATAASGVALTEQVREDDIYLQNFNHDGSKHTGSYTPYGRASDWLREIHAQTLKGEAPEGGDEDEQPGNEASAGARKAAASQRSLKHRPRGRGLTRRISRRTGQQQPQS